ncbi:MAG: PSD1 and planctomycete cytochrome C domain-containing protein, partial [Bryobacteraceae bacterium]
MNCEGLLSEVRKWSLFAFVWLILAALPARAAPSSVSFEKDVLPILRDSCWKCHGASLQLAKLDLRTRESALKGGEHGPVLVPGKAQYSRIYRLAAGLEKPAMPLDGKLTPEQVEILKSWIDSGAEWSESAAAGPDSDAAEDDAAKDAAAQLAAMEDMPIPPEARNYWAFREVVRPQVPVTSDPESNRHPVDAFLMRKLEEKGLTPAPLADRRTLVRRAYLDLIGLPPTPEEVNEFLKDESPRAWERLIEKLLASPHYGERWGRHWLDVARYADSNGFEHDFNRPNAWRYRDYVVRSFNKDTPYNVFIREQLAGDELDWVNQDTLIATGFLRNHAKVGYREKDNPEYRYDYLDDMIATIGRGMLGLTIQCARCHNHKFDPISQKDYYRLQALLFGYVEVNHPLVPPEEAASYEKELAAVTERIDTLRQQVKKIEQPYRDILLPEKYKKFPENVQAAIATPEDKRTPGQALLASQVIRTVGVSSEEIDRIMKPQDLAEKRRLLDEIKSVEQQKPEPIPVAMGITDGDYRFAPDGPGDEPAPGKGKKQEVTEGSFLHEGPGRYQPPPSYFLHRGDPHSRGSLMKPGFLSVVTTGEPPVALPPADGHTSGRRRALAEWIVSPENPLTARVAVNRIWHHHFGRGIVSTLDNFGKMGETPTHPELLDWLASEFMKRGWSIKQMHRLLMTSRAYRMSSAFAPGKNLATDPQNQFLWRYRARRVEAETVRDLILAVSGGLNREMGGPAVFPELPDDILKSMKHGIWERHEDGPALWRRSIYVYLKRGLPFPM